MSTTIPFSTPDISSESTKVSQDLSSDDGILSKLRRMKIQEDLIVQNIKKSICENDNDIIKYELEYKKYVTKLKSSYAGIKQVFHDLKCITNSPDILRNSDIDEIKKDIFGLDEKIKTFKSFLQRELNILKSAEKNLTEQENEKECPVISSHENTKIPNKTYSDIIPSPVRNIINSPFKYPDVQNFHDFLRHTQKHGGWDEYNHNIFIRLWQKHFHNKEDFIGIENLDQYELNIFIDDVTEKIAGPEKSDIISHLEWYITYLTLKKRQKLAIEEWRARNKPNKSVLQSPSLRKENEIINFRRPLTSNLKMKAVQKYGTISVSEWSISQINHKHKDFIYSTYKPAEHKDSSLGDTNESLREIEEAQKSKSSSDKTRPKYTRTTEQWKNRCNSAQDKQHYSNDPDAIIKL